MKVELDEDEMKTAENMIEDLKNKTAKSVILIYAKEVPTGLKVEGFTIGDGMTLLKLYEELEKVTEERDPERAERGIAKYFLRPQMLPILEDRLKNLQSYQQADQVDLDTKTPTDRPT